MKKIILLLSIMLISGCTQDVDGWKIHQSQEACESHGGIDYLNVDKVFHEKVYCNNGTYFTIKQIIDPSKVIHIGGNK